MNNQKTNWAVNMSVSVALYEAVYGAVYGAVWRAVHWVVSRAVYDAVDVGRDMDPAVYGAVKDVPNHPALQDFLSTHNKHTQEQGPPHIGEGLEDIGDYIKPIDVHPPQSHRPDAPPVPDSDSGTSAQPPKPTALPSPQP